MTSMTGISMLALLTSFAAGTISFLSPCVLPLVPGYLSYVTGHSLQQAPAAANRLTAIGLGGFFVLGFSTVFVILGASATALGQILTSYRYEANLVGGAIVILFGLLTVGLVELHPLQRDLRFRIGRPGGHPIAAYLLGMAFAFGWTPCIGPVLGTILTTSAITTTVPRGILLLSVYSAGLALPFLAASLVTERLMVRLGRLRRLGRYLQIGSGAVMLVIGTAMVTGRLSAFSYWLLEAFPVTARIG